MNLIEVLHLFHKVLVLKLMVILMVILMVGGEVEGRDSLPTYGKSVANARSQLSSQLPSIHQQGLLRFCMEQSTG